MDSTSNKVTQQVLQFAVKTKRCRNKNCEQLNHQPLKNFRKSKRGRLGRAAQCRECLKRAYQHHNIKKDAANRGYKDAQGLLNKYGLTVDAYNLMWTVQNGCCAICGSHQSKFSRALSVDHCHTTGKIRNLLCINCNFLLGYSKESLITLQTAIEYLKAHND